LSGSEASVANSPARGPPRRCALRDSQRRALARSAAAAPRSGGRFIRAPRSPPPPTSTATAGPTRWTCWRPGGGWPQRCRCRPRRRPPLRVPQCAASQRTSGWWA